MDKKWKNKIISKLRNLSFAYPPRNKVKKRQQVGPATFECEHCGVWIYEGSRDLEIQREKLDKDPPVDLIDDVPKMDHKEPVVPLEGFERGLWDWHIYMERMFCEAEGFQLLCSSCHKIKTDLEDEMRKNYRKKS